MANPQPAQFTKISNELLEALCQIRINGQACQILRVIIRLTYGYQRKTAEISTNDFIKMTKLSRTAVHKARAKLIEMNIISVPHKGYSNALSYCIQKDYSKWKVYPKKGTVPQKGTKVYPIKGTLRTHKGYTYLYKENLKKERKGNLTNEEKKELDFKRQVKSWQDDAEKNPPKESLKELYAKVSKEK